MRSFETLLYKMRIYKKLYVLLRWKLYKLVKDKVPKFGADSKWMIYH